MSRVAHDLLHDVRRDAEGEQYRNAAVTQVILVRAEVAVFGGRKRSAPSIRCKAWTTGTLHGSTG